MELPELPRKVKGVWQNCNRGMIALGEGNVRRSSFAEQPVLLKLVPNEDYRRLHLNSGKLYTKGYDIWVFHRMITKDDGCPIGFVSKKEMKRHLLSFIDRTGTPHLKDLLESDPANTFEFALGLLEQDLHE